MTGAAHLCASSCLNSLSGLVTLKVTEDIFSILHNISPSLITGTEDYSSFNPESLEKYSAAAVGPGWGISETKKKWLASLLTETGMPCVIDADALNMLSELLNNGMKIKNKNCIITPHIGEFSRLSAYSSKQIQNNPAPLLKDFCEKHNITAVLKSQCYLDLFSGKWIFSYRRQQSSNGNSRKRRYTYRDYFSPALLRSFSAECCGGRCSASSVFRRTVL